MPEIDSSTTYPAYSFQEGAETIEQAKNQEKIKTIQESTEALTDDLQAYGTHISEKYSQEDKQVLGRVMRLLIKMIKVMQDVAIAQSDHLQQLTRYQQAYTELRTQIPLIVVDDSTPLSRKDQGDKQDIAQARNAMNQKLQIWGDNIRALQGVPENDAKKMQSGVNTTNQSVNRLSDLFGVLLRETQELISIILR